MALLLAASFGVGESSYGFELGYGGRLSLPSGAPAEGPVNLTFRFFSAESAGTQLGEISVPNVTLIDGVFNVGLNLSTSQVQDIFRDGSAPVFIETVQGDRVYPRQKFSFVPFALRVPIDEDKLRYENGKLTLNPSLLQASGGVTSVSLTAPASGLTVSGGPITSSGSISLSLANDLAAVESLSTTGVVERTGNEAWSTFSITPAGKDFLAANDVAAQRTKLGLGSLATQSTLSTSAVTEGSNLYFTNVRAREALGATAPLSYSTTSGLLTLGQASSSANGYLSASDFIAFANKQSAIGTTSTIDLGSLTTSSRAGLELRPDLAQTNQTGELRFDELAAHGSNYVGFKAADSLSINRIWTLPMDDGSSGQVLTTNGAGVLSWGTVSSGGGGTVTSVNIGAPAAGITVSGGPIINNGIIQLSLAHDLAAVEGLTSTGGVERIDTDTWATYPLTSAGKALLDDADAGAQRTTLGLGSLATSDTVSGGTGGAIVDGSITNDDISASATIAQSKIANLETDLAGKEPSVNSGEPSQYYRGDKSWQTLDTEAVTEGSRLYFTSARAREAISAAAPLVYASVTGELTISQASSGSGGYLSASDFVAFQNKQSAITPSTVLDSGTLTSSLQNGLEIKPYSTESGSTGELRFDELLANGSHFVGFKAPNALLDNVIWTLPSSDGADGQVLSTNGNKSLSWVTFPSAPVTTVAGRTGAVTLTTGDISGTVAVENGGTGAMTAALARNNLGLGTAATFDVGTGANNILQLDGSAKLPLVDGSQLSGVVKTAGNSTMTGTLTLPANGLVAGSNQLVLSGGNVGIGTTAPGSRLDVDGDVTITDKIIHSGDVDSAIRFPAADTITAETSGAERLRITSTGHVGIGTATPANLLHIVGNYPQSKLESSTTDTAISLKNNSTGGREWWLGSGGSSAGGGANFYIYDATTAGGPAGVRMVINANGNVGIGTTSPATTLDVKGVARLQRYSAQPFACSVSVDGAIALTATARLCTCFGGASSWFFTNDGVTMCSWSPSTGSQAFTYTGSLQSFVVPVGISAITVKTWGAGGGGGGSDGRLGGSGGGGAYATSTLAVIPGETLTIAVGGGGGAGSLGAGIGGGVAGYNGGGVGGNAGSAGQSGGGGGGGGYSGVLRATTPLIVAAGGGGGGGGGNLAAGGSGGSGGGGGVSGSASAYATGGSVGASGASTGEAGTNRGTGDGGGGGGGGGGWNGGGGGGAPSADYSAGGGGGGSNLGVSTSNGEGTVPGNSTDTDREGAGNGGGTATAGSNGRVILSW